MRALAASASEPNLFLCFLGMGGGYRGKKQKINTFSETILRLVVSAITKTLKK